VSRIGKSNVYCDAQQSENAPNSAQGGGSLDRQHWLAPATTLHKQFKSEIY
jgi:hypothetical protein